MKYYFYTVQQGNVKYSGVYKGEFFSFRAVKKSFNGSYGSFVVTSFQEIKKEEYEDFVESRDTPVV